ncbi:MAG: TRAP transporter substrate-binding protein [Alphaproteobacteria bacterium]|nr:TRAP transporter substrate-binding protein [Alphaproteobacteria bacterium]
MSNNKFSRRSLLKGSATVATGAAIGGLGFPALVRSQQQKRMLKPIVAGLNGREGDPTDMSIRLIPKILKEKYDVEVNMQIHPASALGTDLSQLDAVQTGFIDITSNTTTQFVQYSPDFAYVDLPYVIADWDMALRYFKSDQWNKTAANFEKKVPVKVLPPVGAGGYRMLWNNVRALPEPGVVNGLKIRSSTAQLEIDLIKAWGGNATPMAWTETYTGLQTKVVQGFHVQPIWTFQFKMYEQLKFATKVQALYAIQFQVMNAATFKAMPESIQKPFLLAAQEAADIANQKDRELEAHFEGELKKVGMEIYTPSSAEMQKWRSAGEKLWDGAKGINKGDVDAMVALRRST